MFEFWRRIWGSKPAGVPRGAAGMQAEGDISFQRAMANSQFGFGWLPDPPKAGQRAYRLDRSRTLPPPMVDLRPLMPDVYTQGRIQSCTASAVAACVEFVRRKHEQQPPFPPSRLFLYYFGREIDDTVSRDAGLSIYSATQALEQHGVCPEGDWAYDDTPPDKPGGPFPTGSRAARRPDPTALEQALKHRTVSAQDMEQNVSVFRQCLAEGYPFVFGFNLYGSFFVPNSKPLQFQTVLKIPDANEQPWPQLGHTVACVGYKDDARLFTCRNSWGPTYNDRGHFYVPYEFLEKEGLSESFWRLNFVTQYIA